MVNAGRVLIIPQGDWSSLEPYQMLDLVTYDKTAYLARKASVGVNPQTDVQKVYWQPFGTAVEIATTEKPGIVMPDGTTITISQAGVIEAHLILGEAEDVAIVNPQNGQVLAYSSILDAWQNKSLGTAASKDSTSEITEDNEDLIESGAVYSLKQTLENDVDSLDSSKAGKSDLASISITGSTNNTGSTITKGTYFYKSGTLVRAKVDIANGATLTQNTNYEVITAGALNVLNAAGESVSLGNASGNGTKTVSLSSDLNNFKYLEFIFTTGGSFYLLDSIIIPISLFKITTASNLIRLKYDSFSSDVYYESDTTIKVTNNNASCICMIYGIK